jgi:uridine kinase
VSVLHPAAGILLQKASFTIMEACLSGVVLFMYLSGVRRNDAFRTRLGPLMIGVAGDSGAGKDTLVRMICGVLGKERVTVVSGDDYHKWPRGHEMWQTYTHLDARANDLPRQHTDAIMFSLGHSVLKGSYDHATGQFTEAHSIDNNDVLVFQGLHALATEKMRALYDLSVFVEPAEDLRRFWKVRRDQAERGYSVGEVLKSIEDRSGDRDLHILPQRKFADLIVRWYPLESISLEDSTAEPELGLELAATGDFDLAEVAGVLHAAGLKIDFESGTDGDRQRLVIEGLIAGHRLAELADRLLPDSSRMLRVVEFSPNLPGCLQLVFASCLNQRLSWRQRDLVARRAAAV